jgi:hypothetical protein
MDYAGNDIHKHTIVLCVINQDLGIIHRPTFACIQAEAIIAFFQQLGPFWALRNA